MDDNTTDLGNFIRERRERLGIGLNELARRSRLSQATLSKLENGKIEIPQPHRLQALARELDVDYEDLAALAGYLPMTNLPGLRVYLRKQYDDLTPEEIKQVDTYVEFLRQQHNDTNDERR